MNRKKSETTSMLEEQPVNGIGATASGNIDNKLPLLDELGRKPFAEGVATLIKSYSKSDCLVVGIEGVWGEGKSYSIELTRREILSYNETNKDRPIGWFAFNPWYFTDNGHLATLFLKSFAVFLEPGKSNSNGSWRKRLFDKLKPLSKLFSNLRKHPVILRLLLLTIAGLFFWATTATEAIKNLLGFGGGTAIVSGVLINYLLSERAISDSEKYLDAVSKLLYDYADTVESFKGEPTAENVMQLKGQIAEKLTDNQLPYSRIVIAIEDLDRLAPHEVRSMVQLMRMLADFPKVTYLVGYDRNQVIRALGELAGSFANPEDSYEFGKGYLQKVVQAAYQLPRPSNFAIANLVFAKFHQMVQGVYGKDFHTASYWQRVAPLIGQLWGTVRDGERVINRALLMVAMLKEKSNPIDILVASYMMEFQPNLWRWIWDNQHIILGGGRKLLRGNPLNYLGTNVPEAGEHGFLEDQIVADKEDKDLISNIMVAVFPSLQYDAPYHFDVDERKSFPLGSRDYFESYFKYEISAAAEVQDIAPQLLSARGNALSNLLEKVRSYGDDTLFCLFRDLNEYSKKASIPWQTQALPLLEGLGNTFDAIPCPRGPLKTFPVYRVFGLAITWLNMQPEEKRVQSLFELISRWLKDDVKCLPLSLVEKVGQEGGWIPYNGIQKNDNPLAVTLSPDEQTRLKEIINQKLELWSRDGSDGWLEHPNAASMLFQWSRLNPEQFRKQLDIWVQDNWKIFKVLQTMMNESYSQRLDARQGMVAKHKMSIYGLKKLVGMDKPALLARVKDAVIKNPHSASKYGQLIQAVEDLPSHLPD